MPFLCFAILALLGAPATGPAKPVAYPPAAKELLIRRLYSERESTEEWMRSDNQSYFAAVARRDFGGKTTLTVGRAADNDLQIQDPVILPHHLRVTVVGDSFRVRTLDDSARFRVTIDSSPRDTTLGPSSIGLSAMGALWGRYNLRLSHQGSPALILSDAFSPRMKQFHGLKHYAVDLNYRYSLPLTPAPKPETLAIATTRGKNRPALRLGWFDFMVGTTRCRLTAIRLLDPGIKPDDVAVFFRDATNGKETCALGRYIQCTKLGASGSYLLDFNLASNPACAFTDLYSCPIPPKENTLKVPILAGEKDMGYMAEKK